MKVITPEDVSLSSSYVDIYIGESRRNFRQLEVGKIYRFRKCHPKHSLSKWYFDDGRVDPFFGTYKLYTGKQVHYIRGLIKLDSISEEDKFELSLTIGMSRAVIYD